MILRRRERVNANEDQSGLRKKREREREEIQEKPTEKVLYYGGLNP